MKLNVLVGLLILGLLVGILDARASAAETGVIPKAVGGLIGQGIAGITAALLLGDTALRLNICVELNCIIPGYLVGAPIGAALGVKLFSVLGGDSEGNFLWSLGGAVGGQAAGVGLFLATGKLIEFITRCSLVVNNKCSPNLAPSHPIASILVYVGIGSVLIGPLAGAIIGDNWSRAEKNESVNQSSTQNFKFEVPVLQVRF